MSTKTLRKRIALVAVSAITAGMLSVGTMPAANAALNGLSLVPETLYIGVTKSATGTAAAPAAATGMSTAATQVGFITATSSTTVVTDTTAAIYVNSTVSTSRVHSALVFPGAQIPFTAVGSGTTATSSDGLSVVVTGGTLSQLNASSYAPFCYVGGAANNICTFANPTVTAITADSINSSATGVFTDNVTGDIINGVFTVNGAVGSTSTISIYAGTLVAGLTTLTSGALLGQYQFTISAADSAGTASADESTYKQGPCISGSTSAAAATFDTTSRCNNGAAGVIYAVAKDVYALPMNGATMIATATNGAGVYGVATTAPVASTVAAASTSTSGSIALGATGVAYFLVKQPVANVAGSSVVTVTLNGNVVATKTITWAGDIATLTVDTANSNSIFANGTADTIANVGAAGVTYVAKDAAGNVVNLSAQPSIEAAGTTGALVDSTLSATTGDLSYGMVQTSSRGYGYSMLVTSQTSLSGTGTYQLKITNNAGASIKSQVVTATVSRGAAASFTAAWDKAVYAPGAIANLTITAKDAYGNLMATGTPMTGLAIITNTVNMPSVGTACSATTTLKNGGQRVCTFSAGNTEGSYAYSAALTTTTSQAAVTGSTEIKASTAVVSNADVLKSIVALIASINKQIQALQKLILKR